MGSGAERVDGCGRGGKSLVFSGICPAVGLIPTHTERHTWGGGALFGGGVSVWLEWI